MALIAVNWSAEGVLGQPELCRALDAQPTGGRVTVMIHGYRFDPFDAARDPHRHILGPSPRRDCWKAISWPRHLHVGRDPGHLGLAIGWPAQGRLRDVAARAFEAGRGLGAVLTLVARRRPDLQVGLIGHSLGARIALHALHHAPARSVSRVILLSGAEYRDLGRRAAASAAGRDARIVNIRTAENLPFDLAFRLCVPAGTLTALPLSAGLAGLPNWVDLRIDCPRTRSGLRALGHRIAAPRTRFCHWSGYLRPGLFPLYRRLLDPAQTPLLAAIAALDAPQPARSRIGGAGGAARGLSPL